MPKASDRIRTLTEEDFDGFTEDQLRCRGCSGYGNCGFRKYGLWNGKAFCMCVSRRKQLQCERDGIPFEV